MIYDVNKHANVCSFGLIMVLVISFPFAKIGTILSCFLIVYVFFCLINIFSGQNFTESD